MRRCSVPAHRSSLRGRLLPLPFLPQAHWRAGGGVADCKSGIVEFTKGAPTLYASSPGVRRGFCARCGSTLTYVAGALPGGGHIPIGALDRPEDFPPHSTATFAEERLPWFRIAGVDYPTLAGARRQLSPRYFVAHETWLDDFSRRHACESGVFRCP